MQIVLNGELRKIAEGCTLGQLIDMLTLKRERLAIELNREIVPRAQWPETELHDGDRLEIVHFVGGG